MKKFIVLFGSALAFINAYAQNVAINVDGSLPNSSAMLDVKNPNKGILMPRVALTGTADVTTVPSPATSLMVYNTTAAGTGATAVVPGYYFWNGAAWVRMVTSTAATNTVYKSIIPFASVTSFNVTATLPGTPKRVGVVGFGNSGTITQNNATIDLSSGPNYAFVVPSSGTITEISGFLSLPSTGTITSPSVTINCQLFFSATGNNSFTPVSGTSVLLANMPFAFVYSAGTIFTASLSDLNVPVAAGTRIMMVVSASNPSGSGSDSNITLYFSGGVNMVVQ